MCIKNILKLKKTFYSQSNLVYSLYDNVYMNKYIYICNRTVQFGHYPIVMYDLNELCINKYSSEIIRNLNTVLTKNMN